MFNTILKSEALSLEWVRRVLPSQYRWWVLVAILLSLVGYSATTFVQFISNEYKNFFEIPDSYVVFAGIFAFVLHLTNRSRAAIGLMLLAVWLDLHISLYLAGNPTQTATMMVVPLFVISAGFLFGGNIALFLGGITSLTIPTVIQLSQIFHKGTGFSGPQAIVHIVVLEAVLFATSMLVMFFLQSFAQLLDQLKHTENRAQELLENAPDAMLAFSSDGILEAVNPVAQKKIGLVERKSIGKRHDELPLTDPKGQWKRPLSQLSLIGGPFELRVQNSDRVLEALVRTTTLKNGDQGTIVVLRDITKRQRAEAKARELQAQLHHTQKLEAIGRLAGGVAHDFNNLLTGISGYGAMLADSKNSDVQEIGKEILTMQERGATLVRQLLAFARKEVSSPKVMDISEIVKGMSSLIRRLIGENIKLSIHANEPCPIIADPGKIEQVILNLCANGRDAMPNGGKLRIRSILKQSKVELTIEDTGTGMDTETQLRVFEPFFTTKPSGKGTGLGLSIVHGIVADSRGQIEIKSTLGKGTRFRLTWPKSQTGPSKSVIQEQRVPGGNGQTILLAEDDPGTRVLLERFLKKNNFYVISESDGQSALKALLSMKEAPELILSDVVMPLMSGPEFVSASIKHFPHVPYLFMSGYSEDAPRFPNVQIKENIIEKPFKMNELLLQIHQKINSSMVFDA